MTSSPGIRATKSCRGFTVHRVALVSGALEGDVFHDVVSWSLSAVLDLAGNRFGFDAKYNKQVARAFRHAEEQYGAALAEKIFGSEFADQTRSESELEQKTALTKREKEYRTRPIGILSNRVAVLTGAANTALVHTLIQEFDVVFRRMTRASSSDYEIYTATRALGSGRPGRPVNRLDPAFFGSLLEKATHREIELVPRALAQQERMKMRALPKISKSS